MDYYTIIKIIFFSVFFLLMVLKVPIAFCMIGSSILYLFMADESLMVVTQRMLAAPLNFTLLAVPFFMLAGNVMNQGGVTDKIFGFAHAMVGWVPGGLGQVNILNSIVFSGMSGAAVADIGAMGQMEYKSMTDAGFDPDFSLAITASSSLIGPITPPSVPAVLFGAVSGVSVGRLFLGGLIPGLLVGVVEGIIVYIYAKRRHYPQDPVPTLKVFWDSFRGAILPLLTPVIVIGGLMTGVFTPTEAAAVAVLYAVILGVITRELKPKAIPKVLLETVESVIVIIFICGAANVFGYIITTMQVGPIFAKWFTAHVHSQHAAMFFILLLVLFIGTFMDAPVGIYVLVPVLQPVVQKLGIDMVYFGVFFIMALMVGLVTPPVGMVLYVLSNISGVPFTRIARATLPFIGGLVAFLILLIFVPQIITLLPNLVFG
jgi:tripartite ATP-independent transporter DctM subunit